MPQPYRLALLGALVALSLVAASCGDDSSGTPPDGGAVAQDAGPGVDAATADATVQDAASADAATTDAGGGGGDAMAGDTWTSYAQGFFSTYCVPCHAADPPRDYRTIDNVRRDAAEIRCGVTPTALSDCTGFPPPKQFPVGTGPKPADTERQRIVDWIDAGLPE